MRKEINLNSDWLFLQHDITQNASYLQIHKFDFDDSDWRKISLPHDNSIESKFAKENPSTARGGYAYNRLCYYRKRFTVDKADKDKLFNLVFDGVYCNSTVFINEHCLGNYYYGYSQFNYDITPYLNFDGENLLSVKVDNEKQPGSRWYSGTGIYRDVTLEITEKVHLAKDEIVITTPVVDDNHAQVNVNALVRNESEQFKRVKLSVALKDGNNFIAIQSQKMIVGGESDNNTAISFILDNPKLWCNKTPNLYTCQITVQDDKEVEVLDQYDVKFGVRSIEFNVDKGFLINGEKEVLKGVCIHHDNGCLGAAAYRDAFIKKIESMKAMGANAIRTTHNPESPIFLDLCDEYGMYVMEEAFDEWTWGKRPRIFGDVNARIPIFAYAEHFDQDAEKDITRMVKRDRNHASIVMWSIGNEIEELRHEDGEPITKMLCKIVNKHDKTRFTTMGCNGLAPINETQNPDIPDVCGYNYAESFYAPDHKRKPDRAMVGSETSSATAFEPRGCYDKFLSAVNGEKQKIDAEFDPEHQTIEMVNSTDTMGRLRHAEESWYQHTLNPNVAGLFIWTGIDYIGEPTPYVWPSISSYFGPVDRALFPKDAFYFYKSIWSDEDVLYILPHWNLAGYEGKNVPVWCYTNCDEVELFVNGESVGKQTLDKKEHFHIEFNDVIYKAGEIKAVGIRNGKKIETVVKTTKEESKVAICVDHKTVQKGRLVYLTMAIKDEDNVTVPTANNEVVVECSENLELVGIDNGLPTFHEFKGNKVAVNAGVARAVFIAKNCGEATITVKAESGNAKGDCKTVNVTVE